MFYGVLYVALSRNDQITRGEDSPQLALHCGPDILGLNYFFIQTYSYAVLIFLVNSQA